MKRKPEQITVQDLKEWLSEAEVVYKVSNYERKRLICALDGNLIVRTPDKEYYRGMSISAAVDVFNSITDKYIEPTISFKL